MEEEEKRARRQKRRVVVSAVLIALAALLFSFSAMLVLEARRVHFSMVGGEEITVPWGTPYEEPGVRAFYDGRAADGGAEELPIQVMGTVDTGTMGDYELRYAARTLLRSYSVRRLVHVADRTAPEIVLLRDRDYTPNWFEGYREEGYAAFDDDGNQVYPKN